MPPEGAAGTGLLHDCLAAHGGELEDEASARARSAGDVAATRPGQAARERQPEPGSVAGVAGASRAGVEHTLGKRRRKSRAVVAHGDADAPGPRRELQDDLLASVPARIVNEWRECAPDDFGLALGRRQRAVDVDVDAID